MISIEPFTQKDLEDVAGLLYNRNGTSSEYTRWKYGKLATDSFGGVIARQHGEAIGCIGLLPKTLDLASGAIRNCGWFADWYVSKGAQGQGVGTSMLQSLSQLGNQIIFGHPGPTKAQRICLSHGYREIGFQSRRRLILSPWDFERRRIKSPVRVLLHYLVDNARSLHQSAFQSVLNSTDRTCTYKGAARFSYDQEYTSWILSQPVTKGERLPGCWSIGDLHILYVDDTFTSGLRRRLILKVSEAGNHNTELWRSFVDYSRSSNCMYIEMFTTDTCCDTEWKKIGAISVAEPPVLMNGDFDPNQPLLLHGWDRENWTYWAYDA